MDTSQTQIYFDIPLVILAGGKSSRMGEDKALLPLGGYKSLAEYQYKRLSPYFSTIYFSAKTNKFDFEPTVILDQAVEVSSPMIALQSIFATIQNESIFILPVDMPLVTLQSISILVEASKNYEITVAQTNKTHNLCGVFARKIIHKVEHQICANRHAINSLIKESDTKIIRFENDIEFFNVNHKNEYLFILNNFDFK